jgi:hypothetical protein
MWNFAECGLEKLSDNSRRGSLWTLEGAPNDARNPLWAPFVLSNEGARGCQSDLSDSFSRLDFSHLREKGVGYALVTVLGQKR